MDDDQLDLCGEVDEQPVVVPHHLHSLGRNKVTATDGIELPGQTPPRPEFRFPPANVGELTFRHSGWGNIRAKMWRALQSTGASDSRKDRFCHCGSQLWLRLNEGKKEISLACNTCKDRLCGPCGAARAQRMVEAVVNARPNAPLRFVTLTLRCSHASLAAQLDRLYDCFNKLRRREFFRLHIVGGVAMVEAKIGANSGLWHPHLHLLVEGDFIPQRELSREWLEVTGDSSIVDVRRVENVGHAAAYCVKYGSKGCDSSVYNAPSKLQEFVTAVKGRRFALTFGTWRGIKLMDGGGEKTEWRDLGCIDSLVSRSRRGDETARHWLQLATLKYAGLIAAFGLRSDAG